MKLKLLLKKHSLYRQWLVSYLLILMFPIILISIFYIEITGIVENEISRANSSTLKQLQQTMDTKMEEIKKFSMQLATNPRINLAVRSEPTNPMARINYYEAMQDLRNYAVHNTFISRFYVFCHNFDKVITPDTQMDRESLYSTMHMTDEMSFEEWWEIVNQPHEKGYRTIYTKDRYNNAVETFAYFQSLPSNESKNPLATLVILIDKYEFKKSLSNIEWINNGNVFIIDSDNNILASNRDDESMVPVRYESLHDEEGIIYNNIDGSNVAISYISSSTTDWKYVSIMEEQVFWQKAKYARTFLMAGTLFCLLSGIILVFYLLKRNYRPVTQILQTIGVKIGHHDVERYGEYDIISSYVKNISDEKEKLSETLEDQKELLKSNFLIKFLKGESTNEELSQEKLLEYGI